MFAECVWGVFVIIHSFCVPAPSSLVWIGDHSRQPCRIRMYKVKLLCFAIVANFCNCVKPKKQSICRSFAWDVDSFVWNASGWWSLERCCIAAYGDSEAHASHCAHGACSACGACGYGASKEQSMDESPGNNHGGQRLRGGAKRRSVGSDGWISWGSSNAGGWRCSLAFVGSGRKQGSECSFELAVPSSPITLERRGRASRGWKLGKRGFPKHNCNSRLATKPLEQSQTSSSCFGATSRSCSCFGGSLDSSSHLTCDHTDLTSKQSGTGLTAGIGSACRGHTGACHSSLFARHAMSFSIFFYIFAMRVASVTYNMRILNLNKSYMMWQWHKHYYWSCRQRSGTRKLYEQVAHRLSLLAKERLAMQLPGMLRYYHHRKQQQQTESGQLVCRRFFNNRGACYGLGVYFGQGGFLLRLRTSTVFTLYIDGLYTAE